MEYTDWWQITHDERYSNSAYFIIEMDCNEKKKIKNKKRTLSNLLINLNKMKKKEGDSFKEERLMEIIKERLILNHEIEKLVILYNEVKDDSILERINEVRRQRDEIRNRDDNTTNIEDEARVTENPFVRRTTNRYRNFIPIEKDKSYISKGGYDRLSTKIGGIYSYH